MDFPVRQPQCHQRKGTDCEHLPRKTPDTPDTPEVSTDDAVHWSVEESAVVSGRLLALACKLNERIRSVAAESALRWCDGYFHFEGVTPRNYATLLDARLTCFSGVRAADVAVELPEFQSDIKLDDLIRVTCQRLRHSDDSTGRGLLLLLYLVLRALPDKRAKLRLRHAAVGDTGPLIAWLAGSLLREGHLLLADVMRLFSAELLNPSPSSAAVSVAAAHLIRLATKPKQLLNAADYAKLIVLSQRRATDRDRHVRAVLNPLFFRIALSDTQNYARVLMETFPSCPPFAVSIVACCAARSSRFREGWVSQHSRMRDISLSTSTPPRTGCPCHFSLDSLR
jgi:hypothetical protein